MNKAFTPLIGDKVRYELAPNAVDMPRWHLQTVWGYSGLPSSQWEDYGASGNWTEAKVLTNLADNTTILESPNGQRFTVPLMESAPGYNEDQWDLEGFFELVPFEVKPVEELCSACKRMKDIGAACWWCGGGNPHILPSGLDTRRSTYAIMDHHLKPKK
jgi:hypothetical protein